MYHITVRFILTEPFLQNLTFKTFFIKITKDEYQRGFNTIKYLRPCFSVFK